MFLFLHIIKVLVHQIHIKTPTRLEPIVLRPNDLRDIQIEVEAFVNYRNPSEPVHPEPLDRVECRVSFLYDGRHVTTKPLTRDPPPGLKWKGVVKLPDGPTFGERDVSGNYKFDFHAWVGDLEADSQDKGMVQFEHRASIVTLNNDMPENYNGPYFPKYWGSLDPPNLRRGESRVYAVAHVAG